MPYNEYSTHDLMGVVQRLRNPTTFWLDLAFGRQVNFDTQYVDFDLIDKDRRLAPFVAPTVQGRVMKKDGFTTRRFAPAYVKPKDVVDPNHLVTRMAGEPYTGQLSVGQRRDAIVTDLMQQQRNRIVRRWEWMAASAVINGSVTVEGEDYPTSNVDFGRDANQTITLTGADRWGQVGVSIVDNIEEWNEQTLQLSTHFPTDLVFGTEAWKIARKDPGVIALLDRNFRNGDKTGLDIGPRNGEIAQYVGTLGPQRAWVYNDFYEDETGVVQPFMDPLKVVGINPAGTQGVRCFGAIMDKSAGYVSTDIFAKMWENQDPSVEYLMSQSSPLMVPMEPDAMWVALVDGGP